MTEDNFEPTCRCCGRCCYIKRKIGRIKIVTTEPCEHLDKNNLCKIYKDRLHETINGKNICISSKEAYIRGLLPTDCPYVYEYNKQGEYKYKCKVMNYEKF